MQGKGRPEEAKEEVEPQPLHSAAAPEVATSAVTSAAPAGITPAGHAASEEPGGARQWLGGGAAAAAGKEGDSDGEGGQQQRDEEDRARLLQLLASVTVRRCQDGLGHDRG